MRLQPIVWIALVAMVAAGCHAALSLGDLELVDETSSGGTGGAATGSPTGTGGAATGTPTGVGGGQGGGAPCVASECPFVDNSCQTPICNADDECDVSFADLGSECNRNGASGVCTADGGCVECNEPADCPEPDNDECVNNVCVPPQCLNDVQDGSETDVDCGGDECPPCGIGGACQDRSDCTTFFCDDSQHCAVCGDHPDCPSDHWCDPGQLGGTCVPDQDDGAPCGSGPECISGYCFEQDGNGVCCNEACGSPCQTCVADDGASQNGTCTVLVSVDEPYGRCGGQCQTGQCDEAGVCDNLPGGTTCGTAPSCTDAEPSGPSTRTFFECDGAGNCKPQSEECPEGHRCNADNTCNADCVDDGDCYADRWCDTSVTPGVCELDTTVGQACTRDAQCPNNQYCDDGICCDADCSNVCQSCRGDENASGVSGECGSVLPGTDPYPGQCGGYACNLVTFECRIDCNGDIGCGRDHHCVNGACVADRPLGAWCTRDGQCLGGFCTDGVCCESNCSDLCMACDSRRTGQVNDGYCHPILSTLDPEDECTNGCCDGTASPGCLVSPTCHLPSTCGTTPTPPGAACPGACTSCPSAEACRIDCNFTTCRGTEITCPPGQNCFVTCGDAGTAESCEGSTVICPDGYICDVNCGGAAMGCEGLTVIGSLYGTTKLTCDGSQCKNAEVICGENQCTTSCPAAVPDPPAMNCDGSCDCRDFCS